ncbi:hypothetical protein J6590_064865 [Homalodisca vitripennis]|nr:hypothetical protein J6590_064865 [Homalodisca vitripennis]
MARNEPPISVTPAKDQTAEAMHNLFANADMLHDPKSSYSSKRATVLQREDLIPNRFAEEKLEIGRKAISHFGPKLSNDLPLQIKRNIDIKKPDQMYRYSKNGFGDERDVSTSIWFGTKNRGTNDRLTNCEELRTIFSYNYVNTHGTYAISTRSTGVFEYGTNDCDIQDKTLSFQ